MAQSEAEKRIMDGSVWNEFCDQLKELGQLVFRPEVPDDPFNHALGYRHLRTTRACVTVPRQTKLRL